MSNGTPFGGWLKQQRKTLGLTQVELARCVGCSVRTVIQIELGERRPSRQIGELLARCVGIPSEEVPAFVEYARLPARHAPVEAQYRAPWLSLQERPNNLPAPPAAFVGREKEVAAACALLRSDEVRLVTMTGAPGIGKTRMALQVARRFVEDEASAGQLFRDGVFFVALESVRDPRHVAPTIARALKVREAAGEPLDERLKDALRDKHMLLLIDNFEQVIPGAPVLSELLAACPGLKMLITSREILYLYGEYEFRVQPLALPDLQESMPVEQLLQYESVRLFTQRAMAANLDFTINAENAPLVARACVQLEGLPLAIELAAAQIRDLALEEILFRLHARLELLKGGPQDRPTRQRALRAAIDWSYDLLDGSEQALFRRMSVFAGGFTREGAEAVWHRAVASVGDNRQPKIDLSDSMASLVNKSLLQQEGHAGAARWRMLETIREGAAEWLARAGEEGAIQSAHAEYYLTLAESAEPQLKGAQQVTWLQRLDADYDNLRAALEWWLQREERVGALRLSSALWRFWLIRGYLEEGRGWLAKALAIQGSSADGGYQSARADALNGAGNLAYSVGDYESALALQAENLDARKELGDKQGMAGALNNIAVVWRDRGDYERASEYFKASLDLKRELGDRMGIASSLNNLGIVKQRQSDYDGAYAFYDESLRIWREAGEQYGVATALSNVGVVQSYRGEYQASMSSHEESLAIRRDLGDKQGICISLANIASIALAQGDTETARRLHEENLAIRREWGDKPGIAHSLYSLGQVMRQQGDLRQARAFLGESLAIWLELENKEGIAECFAELAGVAVSEARTKREGTPRYRAILEQAARLFGAAEALFEATGFKLHPADRDQFDRSLAHLRERLGEPTWEALRTEGHALALEKDISTLLGQALGQHPIRASVDFG